MNGPHDLGGMHGLGPMDIEVDEPLFHDAWERRVFALTLAMGARGEWNLDQSRHAREDRHPLDYLSSSYYELWLKGLERLIAERNLLSEEGQQEAGPAVPAAVLADMLTRGDSARVTVERPAAFAVGRTVRARNFNPRGHTRLPRYARGHLGEVLIDHGVFVFPDSHAAGDGQKPQHLYAVAFSAQELWGAEGEAGGRVVLDLFEDYLETPQAETASG